MHPLVIALFSTNPIPEVPLAGKLIFFYSNWAKLTQDRNILNIVQRFEILFLENPVQGKSLNSRVLNQVQSKFVKEELKEMLLKGSIQSVSTCKNQYLSNLYLISKGYGGNRSVINLKHLNNFISHKHFKMEGLNLLQNMLQTGEYMCKLDLKDAYFCVPLKTESRKYVRFQWEETLYEHLCLGFGLGPAPLIFTEILKVPISLLKWLQIRVIIYLDDMLVMSQILEELLMSGDTITFLLTQLGFVINLKNSILAPVQQINFLPQRKIEELVQMSQNAMGGNLTLMDLTKLLGKLTSTIPKNLQAKSQIRFLQQIQIKALRKKMTYESVITLDQQTKEELSWWITNMNIYNGKSLLIVPPDLTIFSDASKKGWVLHAKGLPRRSMVFSGENLTNKCSRMKAVRLAILSFTKLKKLNSIHLRIDNMTAL